MVYAYSGVRRHIYCSSAEQCPFICAIPEIDHSDMSDCDSSFGILGNSEEKENQCDINLVRWFVWTSGGSLLVDTSWDVFSGTGKI